MTTPTLKQVLSAINDSRNDFTEFANTMPDNDPVNEAQKRLLIEHGSPKAFALSVANCIGEISYLEAITACRDYQRDWFKAARSTT